MERPAQKKWRRKNPNYQREWREKNKERLVPMKKAYADAHKEHSRDQSLRRLYNINSEQYETILKEQGGVCAICGNEPSGNGNAGKKLHVDHNHDTGKVRGLLCAHCNFGIGYFRENINLLETAIEYIKNSTDPKKEQ